MITVYGNTVNWLNDTNWDTTTLVSDVASQVCTLESDHFNINLPPNGDNNLYFSFKLVGRIPNDSNLSIELIFANGQKESWLIKKRVKNSQNERANATHKLRIRRAWFYNPNENVKIRLKFNNSRGASVTLSNLSIDTIPVASATSDVITVASVSSRNGTGTSGPSGPR